MASTLNSVPDGLIFSADSTGAMNIQANGVTAIQIGSGASVTLSNPPVLSSPLAVTSGGTGVDSVPTNGQLLIGDGTGFTLATLTAGDGMTITNNAGSISLSAAGLPAMNIVSGTTQTAVVNNHYILTNAAATTVTLPASPAAGDVVWVTVANGLSTNVIARNGKKINELEEDMTIDAAYAGIQLRFSGDTKGWVFS